MVRGQVLLGHPYGCEIDTWSLGCIVGEFFLGLPLFPGESEYNQLYRIVEMLGVPHPSFLARCEKRHEYFVRRTPAAAAAATAPAAASAAAAAGPAAVVAPPSAVATAAAATTTAAAAALSAASAGTGFTDGARGSGEGGCEGGEEWLLLPEAEYVVAKNREAEAKGEKGIKLCRNKQYFRYKLLPDLLSRHPPRKAHATAEEAEAEAERRRAMLSFISGLLQYDPAQRWTPRQAIQHPFITGSKYTGRFAVAAAAAAVR